MTFAEVPHGFGTPLARHHAVLYGQPQDGIAGPLCFASTCPHCRAGVEIDVQRISSIHPWACPHCGGLADVGVTDQFMPELRPISVP